MECDPPESAEVVHMAVTVVAAPVTGAVEHPLMDVPLSWKSTVPVGATITPVTVAVKVTESP
jgi:hypothetical protein